MFYAFARALIIAFYKLFFRVKVTGRENIPAEGPVIICSNHISLNDPCLIGAFTKRPVHFLAKHTLFRNPLFNAVMRGINAMPVNREAASMASFKEVMEVLSKGEVLGIFAEGRRMKELDIKNAKNGVALFALKTGAPVIPVKIASDYKLFRKVILNIGPAVDLSAFGGKKIRSEALEGVTDVIMKAISIL
ncbi:MAG: 1-acyl-sn-glycerol-3-phosphate acyltransferase [Clostridiales bacterium]|jgi:1-acyl-sn-glycerol-3-phosphate acyltransferase|nr:1-acyl-sn-glycerol-3-phosphate acyltransferase [Clostridiales bacterium]